MSIKVLKKLRSEIDSSTVPFLGYFAKKYQFVIQDEGQGFHFNNSQCTLHAVVIYCQENDEPKIFPAVLSLMIENTMLLWLMKYKRQF